MQRPFLQRRGCLLANRFIRIKDSKARERLRRFRRIDSRQKFDERLRKSLADGHRKLFDGRDDVAIVDFVKFLAGELLLRVALAF